MEIDVLDANRTLPDENLQTYNYGLNIVKNIQLHKEIVKVKTCSTTSRRSGRLQRRDSAIMSRILIL